eukprot:GHVU01204601.1.p1 GENE.GHVU01204601.1~~GHVU01204601.1.p1  ORF type:complete len:299 (+),score=5.94 GHVU01204601.1:412-1308(+)
MADAHPQSADTSSSSISNNKLQLSSHQSIHLPTYRPPQTITRCTCGGQLRGLMLPTFRTDTPTHRHRRSRATRHAAVIPTAHHLRLALQYGGIACILMSPQRYRYALTHLLPHSFIHSMRRVTAHSVVSTCLSESAYWVMLWTNKKLLFHLPIPCSIILSLHHRSDAVRIHTCMHARWYIYMFTCIHIYMYVYVGVRTSAYPTDLTMKTITQHPRMNGKSTNGERRMNLITEASVKRRRMGSRVAVDTGRRMTTTRKHARQTRGETQPTTTDPTGMIIMSGIIAKSVNISNRNLLGQK